LIGDATGFLKNRPSSEDTPEAKRSKHELLGLIEDYRQGLKPLIVPLTLMKHHLNPYPKELMLRNHV
jgi:uncharacterized protein YbgA (DUF1722 family)